MSTDITFIIPVRHPENAKDWGQLKSNLAQTISSISGQIQKNWSAIIVANAGSDLPNLPSGFKAVYVDFPPNNLYEQGSTDKEAFYEAVRMDKGQRIFMGMANARSSLFYMVVDDDDFISNKISQFVSQNRSCNGWIINNGYIWGDGGKLIYKHNNFGNFCGTSLIIRSDLYKLPISLNETSSDYIKTMLGSHIKISGVLAQQGNPLEILPYYGAIYRVGHIGTHSKSPKIFKLYFFNKYYLLRPFKLLANFSKLSFMNTKIKNEFFGKSN